MSTQIPVIFEGWVEHSAPAMAKWDLHKLAGSACGGNLVSFAQRRAHFLRQLRQGLDELDSSGMTKVLLDMYMSRSFNATIDGLIDFAERPITVRDFVSKITQEAADGGRTRKPPNSYGTLLHYLGSDFSVNDVSLFNICPGMLKDVTLPLWSVASTLECKTPNGRYRGLEGDRRLDPAIFMEPDGARAYPAHQHGGGILFMN